MELSSCFLQKVCIGLAFLFVSVNGVKNSEFSGWSVKNGDGTVCLMVEMDIKTNITYLTKDNASKIGEYSIPNNSSTVAEASSACDKEKEILVVEFGTGNNLSMTFTLSNESYDLSKFVITLNASNIFNDAAENQTVTVMIDESMFKTQGNFSYHCNREQTLNQTGSTNTIAVSHVQFEAFRTSKTKVFSLAKDCDSHLPNDIVPIAVGLALIALIIVVLIAYIVGRRRQRARGYLNIM